MSPETYYQLMSCTEQNIKEQLEEIENTRSRVSSKSSKKTDQVFHQVKSGETTNNREAELRQELEDVRRTLERLDRERNERREVKNDKKTHLKAHSSMGERGISIAASIVAVAVVIFAAYLSQEY